MNPKLTTERLSRRAMVYIRQSSPGQVLQNQESQRRQYGLVDQARTFGFRDVVVIDDDLGRTGSGLMDRPGFQRLVAEVCSGDIGAGFCIEASRLARNGRDWHHPIELCGLTGAVVGDLDGIYDPTLTNDRLLLGMKESMAKFEPRSFDKDIGGVVRGRGRGVKGSLPPRAGLRPRETDCSSQQRAQQGESRAS